MIKIYLRAHGHASEIQYAENTTINKIISEHNIRKDIPLYVDKQIVEDFTKTLSDFNIISKCNMTSVVLPKNARNLQSEETGLKYPLWVESYSSGTKHQHSNKRVKYLHPDQEISLSFIEKEEYIIKPEQIKISLSELKSIKTWITNNFQILNEYSEGEIPIDDFLKRVKKNK